MEGRKAQLSIALAQTRPELGCCLGNGETETNPQGLASHWDGGCVCGGNEDGLENPATVGRGGEAGKVMTDTADGFVVEPELETWMRLCIEAVAELTGVNEIMRGVK